MGTFATWKFAIFLLPFVLVCQAREDLTLRNPTTLISTPEQEKQAPVFTNQDNEKQGDFASWFEFENNTFFEIDQVGKPEFSIRIKRAVARARDSRGRFVKTTPKPTQKATTTARPNQASANKVKTPDQPKRITTSNRARVSPGRIVRTTPKPNHKATTTHRPNNSHNRGRIVKAPPKQNHHTRHTTARPHAKPHSQLRDSESRFGSRNSNIKRSASHGRIPSVRLGHLNQNRREAATRRPIVAKATQNTHTTPKHVETTKGEPKSTGKTETSSPGKQPQQGKINEKPGETETTESKPTARTIRKASVRYQTQSRVPVTDNQNTAREPTARPQARRSIGTRRLSTDETKIPQPSTPSGDSTIRGQRYLRRASVPYQSLQKTVVKGDDGKEMKVGYKSTTIVGGPYDGLQKVERAEIDLKNIGKHETKPTPNVRNQIGTNKGGANEGFQAGHILPAVMKGPNNQPWNFVPVSPEFNRKWSQVEGRIKEYLESGKETKASFVFDYSKKTPNSNVPIGLRLELNPPVPGVKNGYYAMPGLRSTGTPPAA